VLETEYIEQPASWDMNNIYVTGFTPLTQPHREHWRAVYELARYPEGWRQKMLEQMRGWYADGSWIPDARVLEGEGKIEGLVELLVGVHLTQAADDNVAKENEDEDFERKSVWIKAMDDAYGGIVEVEFINGHIGNRRREAD
jgi:hypothetical protein